MCHNRVCCCIDAAHAESPDAIGSDSLASLAKLDSVPVGFCFDRCHSRDAMGAARMASPEACAISREACAPTSELVGGWWNLHSNPVAG